MANNTGLADHLLSIPRVVSPPGEGVLVSQKYGADLMAMYGPDGRIMFLFESAREVDIIIPDGPDDEPLTWEVIRNSPVVNFDECDREGLTYFIGGDEGPIKIGRTKNLPARLKGFQAYCPIPLRVHATRKGCDRERVYHDLFAAHRLHGEWFAPHPDILAEIDRLNSRAGKRLASPPAHHSDEVTSHG